MKNFEITWGDFPDPCYDPQGAHGDCPATFLELIRRSDIDAVDRIWAFSVCPKITDSHKRIFGVRGIRETPIGDGKFVVDLLTDQRSLDAIEVAERFAHGDATIQKMAAAWAAAWDAAWAAARTAAWDAARAAAVAAAGAAARTAARTAAWDAARAAAVAAARAATRAATRDAARMAAWDAAKDAQIDIIISMLE